VCANIGSPEEAAAARSFGADGVGLFRTEFLYMNGDRLPTEDEQYAAYSRAAEALEGRPLTIRTLDIGGDKDLPALGLVKEDNPFLGYRAVRVSLARQDVFKPQLRAALRAAAKGPVELMFPLVISVDETRALKTVLEACRAELDAAGVPTGPLSVGIMVETPAAALMARALAAEVDFFSIGTNDLTQYTLAVDRGNSRISSLYDPFNPAVLRLIAETCAAARDAGIPAAMCGEFASNERAVPLLVGFGLTEFSVAAARIPAIKAAIRRLDSAACRDLAARVLRMASPSEVRAALEAAGRR
jgi:phosphotransferase system enzyme I (PtsI)